MVVIALEGAEAQAKRLAGECAIHACEVTIAGAGMFYGEYFLTCHRYRLSVANCAITSKVLRAFLLPIVQGGTVVN